MFKIYTCLISILLSWVLNCNINYSQEVISSQGTVYSNSDGSSISFTIGEPIIKTINGSVNDVTQGFQQPIGLTTSLTDLYCGSELSPYDLSSKSEDFEIYEISNKKCIWKYEWKITNETTNATIYAYTAPGGFGTSRHKMNLNLAISSSNSRTFSRIDPISNWSNPPTPLPSGFLTSGTTYSIQVRAKFNVACSSVLTLFGRKCYVKLPSNNTGPTTKLIICNTINNPQSYELTDKIYCDPVPNIYRYLFEIVDTDPTNPLPTVVYNSQSKWRNYFTLSDAGFNQTNKTYAITVYAWMKQTAASDAQAGNTCYVSSPTNDPTVKLITDQCGSVSAPIGVYDGDVLEAVINPAIQNTTQCCEYKYIFEFYHPSSPTAFKTCTTENSAPTRRKLCLNNCPPDMTISADLYPNIGDQIKVRTKAWVKNAYDPSLTPPIYLDPGGDCWIVYLGSKSIKDETSINLKIFPNPNDGSHFYINAYGFTDSEDDIIISVIDLHGKQVYIENTGISANQLIKEITLNEKLADGIYLIEVAKGPYKVIQKLIIQ